MRGVRVGQRQAACASRLVRTMRGPRVLRVVAWSSGVEGQRRARKLGRSCTHRQTGDAVARTAGFDEMARRADELRGLEAGVFRRYDASYAEGHPCLRCGGGCACARWRVGGWHACKVHACVHCRRSAGLTGLTVQPSSIIDYSDACRSFGVRAVLTGLCARRAGRFGEQSIACGRTWRVPVTGFHKHQRSNSKTTLCREHTCALKQKLDAHAHNATGGRGEPSSSFFATDDQEFESALPDL